MHKSAPRLCRGVFVFGATKAVASDERKKEKPAYRDESTVDSCQFTVKKEWGAMAINGRQSTVDS